jgi:hypothetical protein
VQKFTAIHCHRDESPQVVEKILSKDDMPMRLNVQIKISWAIISVLNYLGPLKSLLKQAL